MTYLASNLDNQVKVLSLNSFGSIFRGGGLRQGLVTGGGAGFRSDLEGVEKDSHPRETGGLDLLRFRGLAAFPSSDASLVMLVQLAWCRRLLPRGAVAIEQSQRIASLRGLQYGPGTTRVSVVPSRICGYAQVAAGP